MSTKLFIAFSTQADATNFLQLILASSLSWNYHSFKSIKYIKLSAERLYKQENVINALVNIVL